LCLSARNRRKQIGKELAVYSQLLLGLGAPDCPVVHRTVSGAPDESKVNRPLSGLDGGVRLKFTGLCQRNGRPRNPRATRGPRQRSAGGTGLSGAPSGPKQQRSTAPYLEGDPHRTCYSDCPVVHRTVRCTTRQKARIAFLDCLQWLLAALGL
jgi:hypothetical protein